MKKKIEKLTGVLLTVALLVCLCSLAVFADGGNDIPVSVENSVIDPTLPPDPFFPPDPPAPSRVKGDVNGDGFIDIVDAMLSAYHVAEKEFIFGEDLDAADIDSDGTVDLSDLMVLLFSVAYGGTSDHCHIFEDSVIPSTCTDHGSLIKTCKLCGTESVCGIIPAAHKYEITEETAPTCETDGKTVEECSVCGERTETVLPATGHKMHTETTAPTCEADGEEVSVCADCGMTVRKTLKARHRWEKSKTVSAPTENSEGTAEFICADCGKLKTEDIPRLRGESGIFKYYTQWDGRWSSAKFGKYTMGRNGCAPTSVAMALSYMGINVTPIEVANWLYGNTEEFCKTFSGSSGSAIRLAAEHYGATTLNIFEYEDLLSALENDGAVCIAVGKGIFCDNGTHCIFLYGYDAESGKVNAADPWTRKMNGSYDLSRIWAERSAAEVDMREDGCVAYGIR